MFTQNEYLMAWGAYLLGGLMCFYCWWMITAKISPMVIRLLLRTVVAVLLFMPWYVDGTAGYLAPAVVAMSIEGLFVSGADFSRAGLPLMSTLIIACLVTTVISGVWYFYRRKK